MVEENKANNGAAVLSDVKSNVLNGLEPIKKKPQPKEIKKVEMEAVAIDGFGNRVFVSEKKVAAFKKKNNL